MASQFAYRWLIENGYVNVWRYSGGISDWAAAGYELESDSEPGLAAAPFFLPAEANPPRSSRPRTEA